MESDNDCRKFDTSQPLRIISIGLPVDSQRRLYISTKGPCGVWSPNTVHNTIRVVYSIHISLELINFYRKHLPCVMKNGRPGVAFRLFFLFTLSFFIDSCNRLSFHAHRSAKRNQTKKHSIGLNEKKKKLK